MSNIKHLFDEKGNCPTLGDPFRDPYTGTKAILFVSEGYLKSSIELQLKEIANQPGARLFCDAVVLIIAERFACNTKGNYSTIYYWR